MYSNTIYWYLCFPTVEDYRHFNKYCMSVASNELRRILMILQEGVGAARRTERTQEEAIEDHHM